MRRNVGTEPKGLGFLRWLFDTAKTRDAERWYSMTYEQKALVYRYTVLVFLFGVLCGLSGGAFLWL